MCFIPAIWISGLLVGHTQKGDDSATVGRFDLGKIQGDSLRKVYSQELQKEKGNGILQLNPGTVDSDRV